MIYFKIIRQNGFVKQRIVFSFLAVAVAFGRDQNELFRFGDRTDGDAARLQPRCAFALFDDMFFLCAFRQNDFSGEFAVRIEIVSFGAPVDAEIMPSVGSVLAVP